MFFDILRTCSTIYDIYIGNRQVTLPLVCNFFSFSKLWTLLSATVLGRYETVVFSAGTLHAELGGGKLAKTSRGALCRNLRH